ncbi:hypothetical protein BH20ACI2_BH20ACI2_14730 [soil metagenome]
MWRPIVMTPSGYEIEYIERKEYLSAKITGPSLCGPTALAYLAEIVIRSAELRHKKLLLDRDIPAALDESDMFAAVNELVRMGSGMRIALVNRHIPTADTLEYAMNYGREIGADFKYFNDTSEAERWLLKGD